MQSKSILLLLVALVACASKPMLVAPPVLAKPESASTENAPIVALQFQMETKAA